MYQTEKNNRNADLVSAFLRCPFGETVSDCPFIQAYQLNNPQKQIMLLNSLPGQELEQLRSHHRTCMALRRADFLVNGDPQKR
ncbi:MAG: hypothetical protein RBS73_05005 [Prolixibacteraceae bacterium]|nr:hypothetical protein [Prolixibacteraceae bacterium]